MSEANQSVHYQQASRPLPPPPADYHPRPAEHHPAQPEYRPPQPRPRPARRRGSPGKAIALLIIVLLLLAILFYTPLGHQFFSLFFDDSYPAYSTFTVTRSVEVSVSGGEIDYTIDVPMPDDISTSSGNAQEVHSVTTTPTASTVMKDNTEWLEWHDEESSDFSVSVTYGMTVHTRIWDIDASDSGHQDNIPGSLVLQQTGNEWEYQPGHWKIWPTNPQISALARGLTSDDASVIENLRSLYNYVNSEITYNTYSGSEPKACLDTLRDGAGDCDDQSILLISLCRAVGIPSWLAFGALYDSYLMEWGPHAWAEIYIPLAAGGGEAVTVDTANSEFLVRNCNRYQEWESDGNGTHLEDYYHVITYNYTLAHPNSPPPTVLLGESFTGVYAASSETIRASGYMGLCFRPDDLSLSTTTEE